MENKDLKLCECGCGTPVKNRFVNHHAIRVNPISQSAAFRERMCGENNPSKRPEVREKISKNRKGIRSGNDNHMRKPEYKKMFSEKYTGTGNPNFGKKATDETRIKMSVSQKNRPPDSIETKKRKSESKKGVIHSIEHRKKISETFKREGISNGENNAFYGKRHNSDTLKKLSELRIEYAKKIRLLPGLKKSDYPIKYQIRNSVEYNQWRKSIFNRDFFTCQICNEKGGKLTAHHHHKLFSEIFHINNIQSFQQALECKDFWDIDNGITLCEKCHRKLHKESKPIPRKRK